MRIVYMSTTITLPKNVLDAIKAANGVFVASASASLNNEGNGLGEIKTREVTLKIGDSKPYSIAEVNGFTLDNGQLKSGNENVPASALVATAKGGASVHCEKCARKTRSRRHKRAGRRHRKSSKKV
jgi:hypothetical protein